MRRRWSGWAASWLLLGIGCQRGPVLGPQAGEVPIIDAHIHTDFDGKPERTSGVPFSLPELLRQMRAAGVVGAVAHTDEDGGGFQDLSSHGIIHCAGIGARLDTGEDLARVEAGLREGRYRCIKIYLGYVHRYAADPAYEPFYQLAARHDVPVVFHTGDTYSQKAKLKYADPLTVDEVAVDHPGVRFVLAHSGNPWIQSAAEVAYKNPNVFLDGSALLIGKLEAGRDGRARQQIDEYIARPIAWVLGYMEDPSKLLFGTDWPLVEIAPYAEAFRRAVPRQSWRAVFHDNAARVFKLKRPAAP
jgi:hypothetical protein